MASIEQNLFYQRRYQKEVTTKIHSPIYGAHLGRKKTCNKVTERMYRPGLKNEVIDMRRDDKQIGINC
jgi:hypothetical protein